MIATAEIKLDRFFNENLKPYCTHFVLLRKKKEHKKNSYAQ